MRDFRSSNSNRFNRGSRDNGGRRPSMHDAVCNKCGRDCKVPFMPTGNKPVFCSNCFERQSERPSGGRDFGRYDRGERQMFSATCDKCGNECKVPFQPSGDKPVFCNNCFDKKGDNRGDNRGERESNRGNDNSQLQEQINLINGKLDKILQALESKKAPVKKVKKVENKTVNKVVNKAVKKTTKTKKTIKVKK